MSNRKFRQHAMNQAGRNDPCPCGSGLKYKRCCLGTTPTTELPPADVRDRIAHATHQAVDLTTNDNGTGRCSLYAWVGVNLAKQVTGREYWPQIGSVHVLAGEDEDGPYVLQMDPAFNDYDGREFHVWFVAVPTGAKYGETWTVGPEAEIVDLSLREMPMNARRVGVPWMRDPWPDYYWGSFDGLLKLGVSPRVDERCMDTYARSALELDGELIKETARLAAWLYRNPQIEMIVPDL